MNKEKLKAIHQVRDIISQHDISFTDLLTTGNDTQTDKKESKKVLKLKKRHKKASDKKVGEKVKCPMCRKAFKKKASNQIYCSSKGEDNCKDRYHNTLNSERLNARK